uniref:Uncharacterized protein n=1 Tax=Arundo donax TaxID=35708 RepID=A0A0A9BSD3_ARUDO
MSTFWCDNKSKMQRATYSFLICTLNKIFHYFDNN